MSNDDAKPAAKAKPVKADDKPPEKPADKPAVRAKPAERPPFDERKLAFAELAAIREILDRESLVAQLRDGRAVVRANAALGLAAIGQIALELVMLLRDSEAIAASAAAEAISRLGPAAAPMVPQIVQALDGTQPDVTTVIIAALGELVGQADDELAASLDVPFDLAMKSVVEACAPLGKRGVAFLIKACAQERSRIRMNAVGGLGKIGKADAETVLTFLGHLEQTDPIPDVRQAAKKSMLAVVAREKVVAVDALPKNIPDFEERKLSASELAEVADTVDIDALVYALSDGRNHVRINGARALAAAGARAARAAPAIGLVLRDSIAAVRREAAKSLAKLGAGAVDAAADLVGALSDAEADVAEAASETLGALGERVQDALVKGLETGDEAGGLRVGELIGKLPRAVDLLVEAFKSPAVNVQVNAALGLGLLGKARVGAGLATLHGARTGGDARTREAVRRALEMIEPKRDAGPQPLTVDGFEDRNLSAAELDKAKAELERVGVTDITAHLQDGRDVVRANAATALGALGAAALPAARAIGVRLRDDAARVRQAAAQALDRIGDAAIAETADDLVGALGDSDAKVAETCSAVLRARKAKMIGALVRGLETDKPEGGRRICELINVFPDAPDILCDALESPAVNVQVNAALGLGMLGDRVGRGRKALEGKRTGGWEQTRVAVRKALEVLDGPRRSGPAPIEVDGFETKLLDAAAFANAKLRADDLVTHLQDGRAIVRANAATALGTLGAPAAPFAMGLAVLLRDDDPAVRIAAAGAVDKLGDDVVKEVASYLVGALRGDANVAAAVAKVLAARKARVLGALVKGLETDDETHARRIAELINLLPDACEILCDAFESPAENVQVNAAIGIGMLGEKRAGSQGKKVLEGARTGGFARTREAVFKALAMLKG